MSARTTSQVVRQHEIPDDIASLCTLGRIDYADVFTALGAAAGASAEEWARATLETAPRWARFLAWQTVLGLRIEPHPAPGYLAGWEIDALDDRWIRLGTDSWHLAAQIVFHIDDADAVSFATFLRYDRPPAAVVWPPLSVVHRRAAPNRLRSAVGHIARSRP